MARKRKSKIGVVRDARFYTQWNRLHTYCQCCGVPWRYATLGKLTTHHIVKFRRSDEACNLLRLCLQCHDLAEGHTIRNPHTREPYPRITLGICLGLKALREPSDFDSERLTVLYGRRLPDPEVLPEVFARAWRYWERRRGELAC